jgi:alanyl-tRNA synthetase
VGTERIYYKEPYCIEFDATVVRAFTHEGKPAVELDRTAFYPTSGGQPFDTGTLDGTHVVNVVDLEDGTIVHVLDAAIPENSPVHGEIDWRRRFDHMQQHTGQHVLSAAFDHLFDNRTMSFHMSADVSTIDLAKEASAEAIAAAEHEANRILWEDREVSIRFVSAEEAAALPLRKEPARGGTLRLIDIADFDLSACGGSHVARTGAIGIIAVSGWERFRGGTRVTFVCGSRALRLFRTYRDSIAGSIRSLSVLPEELPSAIERVQNEGKELRRTLKTMQESLASHEAARMVSEATTRNSEHGTAKARIVVRAVDGWDAAGLKAIAAAATSRDGVVTALFSASRPALAVVAKSRDLRIDCGAVLKDLVQQFGGRGGGKADLAQGGGLDADEQSLVAAARKAIESQLRA